MLFPKLKCKHKFILSIVLCSFILILCLHSRYFFNIKEGYNQQDGIKVNTLEEDFFLSSYFSESPRAPTAIRVTAMPSNKLLDSDTDQYGFPYFSQMDSRWKEVKFGVLKCGVDLNGGGKGGGCGPSSFAMLATYLLGRPIYPDETCTVAGERNMCISTDGSEHKISSVLSEYYGLECVQCPYFKKKQDIVNYINEHLDAGYVVHLSGGPKYLNYSVFSTSKQPFTGGHYIGIYTRLKNGNWWIADSGRKNAEYKPLDLLNAGANPYNIWFIKTVDEVTETIHAEPF